MIELEEMAWAKIFPEDERRQMLAQLLHPAGTAIERDDPSIFNATWKGWTESAELLSDPEPKARLTADDPATGASGGTHDSPAHADSVFRSETNPAGVVRRRFEV